MWCVYCGVVCEVCVWYAVLWCVSGGWRMLYMVWWVWCVPVCLSVCSVWYVVLHVVWFMWCVWYGVLWSVTLDVIWYGVCSVCVGVALRVCVVWYEQKSHRRKKSL